MTEAQLRAFVAVVEAGTFAAAARRLHMTQPGVSRAVRSLEAELDGPLLVRGSGPVELTDLGIRVLARSRTVLAETDAIRQERERRDGAVVGRVRLGSMPSVSAQILPRLVARLERRHSGLEVTVLDGHDDELVEWVRTGTVDLAVVAGQHDGLEHQLLLEDEFLAVLPKSHALANAQAVPRRAFAEQPFILTRAGCERLVLQALSEAGVVPVVAHEVSEPSSILAMVSENLGVSVMPGLAAARPPRSVTLLPLEPPARRILYLAALPARTGTPAIRAVLAEAARSR